jgi:hypothetical protein
VKLINYIFKLILYRYDYCCIFGLEIKTLPGTTRYLFQFINRCTNINRSSAGLESVFGAFSFVVQLFTCFKYCTGTLSCSVVDLCHFYTDPDPRMRTPDLRIRILLFSSVTFKMPTKSKKLYAYYFLKIHLHHSSKLNCHKEVTEQ